MTHAHLLKPTKIDMQRSNKTDGSDHPTDVKGQPCTVRNHNAVYLEWAISPSPYVLHKKRSNFGNNNECMSFKDECMLFYVSLD